MHLTLSKLTSARSEARYGCNTGSRNPDVEPGNRSRGQCGICTVSAHRCRTTPPRGKERVMLWPTPACSQYPYEVPFEVPFDNNNHCDRRLGLHRHQSQELRRSRILSPYDVNFRFNQTSSPSDLLKFKSFDWQRQCSPRCRLVSRVASPRYTTARLLHMQGLAWNRQVFMSDSSSIWIMTAKFYRVWIDLMRPR
jgi:hypothetical protein